MLKYRAVKKQKISEETSRKHMDFHKLMEKAAREEKPVKFIERISPAYRLAAAACLLIALAGASYGILFHKKVLPSQKPALVRTKLHASTLLLETYEVPVNTTCAITFDEVKLIIQEGAIQNKENSDTGEVKISEKFSLNVIGKEGFFFFIDFKKGKKFDKNSLEIEIDTHSRDSLHVYYGGSSANKISWQPLEQSDNKIIAEPTHAMLEYERYMNQVTFMDTLAKFYKLKGNTYTKADGKGLRYEKNSYEASESS